ncbi:DUF7828 domain-containing protein [Atlantibacter hermannii]|uniref:DUF7828 domain-containing protein n=1 Tax=Atlantibacter hermannii TaxID=565 RepID=UPI00406CF6E1
MIYAKTLIAISVNGHLNIFSEVQTINYINNTCLFYRSTLQYLPEYSTACPYFEHTDTIHLVQWYYEQSPPLSILNIF